MKTIVLTLVGALATACAPGLELDPEVHVAPSPRVPLAQYRTFSLALEEVPPATYEASPRSLEAESHMRELLRSAFRQKGYVENDKNPDFLIRFGAGTKPLEASPYDSDLSSSSSDDGVDLQRIGVDIYDAPTNTEVWRGSKVSLVKRKAQSTDDALLQRDLGSLLAVFPVRR